MTTLDDVITGTNRPDGGPCTPHEPIQCADGMDISVQAGRAWWSIPRDNAGPFTHVEVFTGMYATDDDLTALAEYEDAPGSGVYGRVPVATVRLIIAAHGGEAR